MPTYTFRCDDCKHEFDKLLKIAEMDDPLSEPCPECSNTHVKRIFSSAASIAFMDPVRAGFQKPSGDWTNWLNKLKKKNPGCPDFNTFR